MPKKKIIVLTGAGISAESGIQTFRGGNGLWEGHRIEDVASPDGWRRDRQLVLDFYNLRRRQLATVSPNAAHYALAKLDARYDVTIITQNVDDLHERAGSKKIIHLHGELIKACSTIDESLVYEWRKDISIGDLCEKGSQLRPHIVWFGEMVPLIKTAEKLSQTADIFIVIGTSLQVYPAAGLLYDAPTHCTKYLIDPTAEPQRGITNLTQIPEPATIGVTALVEQLMME